MRGGEVWVTVDRVAAHVGGLIAGPVDRCPMPGLAAFNHALGGGVTRSLRLDQHGKSLSPWLLDMEGPGV